MPRIGNSTCSSNIVYFDVTEIIPEEPDTRVMLSCMVEQLLLLEQIQVLGKKQQRILQSEVRYYYVLVLHLLTIQMSSVTSFKYLVVKLIWYSTIASFCEKL